MAVDVFGFPLPEVDESDGSRANTEYARFRTQLASHRTGLAGHNAELAERNADLAEHNAELSEANASRSFNRTELAGRRTGLAFQRTRMSADRTLMAVIRTSLSMIAFGFTIYTFFRGLEEKHLIGISGHPGAFFGRALVWLGVGMVAVGILYHLGFMLALRRQRRAMVNEGLFQGQIGFPVSLTLLVALALLLLGLFAIAGIAWRLGPFG
jgi:uncharacterized membrane protein YidH (DUF202 family)